MLIVGVSMKSQLVTPLSRTQGDEDAFPTPVSNDNPFSELQFKTMKYRPEFPVRSGPFDQAHVFSGSALVNSPEVSQAANLNALQRVSHNL